MFRVTADTVRVHVPFTRIGRVKMSFVHFNNIIISMFSSRLQKVGKIFYTTGKSAFFNTTCLV